MAGLIDVAYVEILPDLKKFDKQATKEIKAALDDAAKEADKAGARIEESLSESFKESGRVAKRTIDGIERRIKEVDGVITVTMVVNGEEVVEKLKRDLNGRIRKSNGQFATTGELAGLGLAGGAGEGFRKGFFKFALPKIFDGITDTFSTLKGPLIAYGVTIGVQLAGALAPAVTALAASLPAAIGVASASLATLILGFQGLGDAIKNFDDDEKFQEALKNLSPAAQRFAKELRALVPIFKSIKDAAQEGLFKGFEGQITRLTKAVQGPLRAGLNDVGRSLQHLGREMIDLIVTGNGIPALQAVFATTAKIINDAVPSLQIFVAGILDLVVKALPFVQELAGDFATFLEMVGQKLFALSQNGGLDQFFTKALETLRQLGRIALNVGKILAGLFGANAAAGEDWLDVIEGLTKRLADFLSQKDVVEGLSLAFSALGKILQLNFKIMILSADAGKAIGEAIASVVRWTEQAIAALVGFGIAAKNWLVGAWQSIVSGVSSGIDAVVSFFSALPARIVRFLEAIPGALLGALKTALSAALQAVGVAIGAILFAFLELPQRIPGYLAQLGTIVVNFFTGLWTQVVTFTVSTWNDFLAWLTALPAKIVASIVSLYSMLQTFFTQLWQGVLAWAISGWNSVIAFISSVPSRIAAMAIQFYNSGINLIKGLFNGITSGAASSAAGVGNAIFGAFKSGLNWAIRQINAGIASVDDKLPGNLPRIPTLASGGLALGPSIVGEAGAEVALPLTGQRGKKALELLANAANNGGGGGGITFASGSVAVTFEGVVPTQAQAQQTGEAVGAGIASLLKKRDARTLVRMA